jgi:hypothetical protein
MAVLEDLLPVGGERPQLAKKDEFSIHSWRYVRAHVNAGAKMHRFVGAKMHQGCWQKAPELGAFFIWHQAWVGLSSGGSELARRDRRLL